MNHPHHRSRLPGRFDKLTACRLLLHAGLAAALLQSARAQPNPAPGFTATPLYTHSTSDAIVSYDWAAATGLYYMTSASYPEIGASLWKATGGAPQNLYSNSSNFAGNNVVTIGDYVHFNDSDLSNNQYIRRYGPVTGSAVTTLTSTAANFGLYGHAGSLFITAKNGSAPANLFYSGLAGDGHLLSDPPLSLGDPVTGLGGGSGGSGPLAFDLAGNLYYAPGYSDTSIYKFAASEVADAIAQNGHPLKVTGHQWLNYGAAFPDEGGASSLLIDPDGDLLVTLTSFSSPSVVVEFGVAANGSYDNTATQLLSDTDRLGELRLHDGKLYVSSGNGIYEVVPEPGTFVLLTLAMGALGLRRRRMKRVTLSAGDSGLRAKRAWVEHSSRVLCRASRPAPERTQVVKFTLGVARAHGDSAGRRAQHSGRVLHPSLPAAATASLWLGALAVFSLLPALAASAIAGPYSTGLANVTANAPDAGIPGFVGPAGDGVVGTTTNQNIVNPLFVGWATSVVAYLPAPGVGTAFSHSDFALGPVTGDNASIVSLGDVPAGSNRPNPGTLTLGFDRPITNGPGADFAAFENGFISDGESGVEGEISGELGYVEVSTDGTHFARFSSVSLTPAAVGAYGTFDSSNVYNLVGKHVNAFGDSWGTPFDLQSLTNDALVVSGLVDLTRIIYVRIVDISGDGTWVDGAGHSIFDAWLTFGSGGVDFEALGVIHEIPEPRLGGWIALGFGSLLAARQRAA
jgi:hypothetical protein